MVEDGGYGGKAEEGMRAIHAFWVLCYEVERRNICCRVLETSIYTRLF